MLIIQTLLNQSIQRRRLVQQPLATPFRDRSDGRKRRVPDLPPVRGPRHRRDEFEAESGEGRVFGGTKDLG